MSSLQPLLDALDEGHREFKIALEGLSDADLWLRPHPRLWSVGELAGHVAYGLALWVFGDGTYRTELANLPIQSPLLDPRFAYYALGPETPTKLDLGVTEVLAEVERVHRLAEAALKGKEMSDAYPGQWGTWGALVQYEAFHVAYHTGQIYSARHLMGHETEDN